MPGDLLPFEFRVYVLRQRLPGKVHEDIVDFALEHEGLTPRKLVVNYTDEKRYFVLKSSVYRIRSTEDLITAPAHVVIRAASSRQIAVQSPAGQWTSSETLQAVRFHIPEGHRLGMVLSQHNSRRLMPLNHCLEALHHDEGCECHRHAGVELGASACNSATVAHKPRLVSDNGSSQVAPDLADHLDDKGTDHVRGAPHHPQTQGKIERRHQTIKNRVLLGNYFLPCDLKRQIGAFVDHYNNHRYHESLDNPTPADVYHGPGAKMLKMREEIKVRRT
ncbi:MAG: integrase core domain-containing protein [Roseobacter sp.]|jgi:transposase InsO family protein|nr:integrase core domain-containing protein [Roseobacter sp.]